MAQANLVTTDGSAHADKVVRLAGDLAQLYGANIVLLHAFPNPMREGIPESYEKLAASEHVKLGDTLISLGEEILRPAEANLRA